MRFQTLTPLMFFSALLIGCQQPVLDSEIQAMSADCDHIADQVASLQREEATTNERIASGIKAIIPTSAVVHLFRGELKREAKIATGEYNRMLAAKISELKRDCAV